MSGLPGVVTVTGVGRRVHRLCGESPPREAGLRGSDVSMTH